MFDVACGVRYSLNETYRILAQNTGYTQPPVYVEPRAGDIRNSLADISAARDAFGYEVIVPFAEGLALTVDWHKQQLHAEG